MGVPEPLHIRYRIQIGKRRQCLRIDFLDKLVSIRLSMPKNRLLIQVAKGALRIEFRLELPVVFTIVNTPELVFGEEGCRIE